MVCTGSVKDIELTLVNLERDHAIIVASLCGLQAAIALIATVYIFASRPWNTIPTFVSVQMAFLNGFWLCFVPYNWIVIS